MDEGSWNVFAEAIIRATCSYFDFYKLLDDVCLRTYCWFSLEKFCEVGRCGKLLLYFYTLYFRYGVTDGQAENFLFSVCSDERWP